MDVFVTVFIVAVQCIPLSIGAGCNAYTGAIIRDYEFNYTSGAAVTGSALSNNEHTPNTDTQLEVILDPSDYSISCACGIITMWQFYAWHPGTVVFYALDGTTVKGTSSFTIGTQSQFNFFEVPLSSDMWIPVQRGYKLGFFTEDEPMITYQSTGGFGSGYYNTGQTLQSVSGSVVTFGTPTSGRKYAVAAYVIEAHPPMFVNAPFETTLYTHDTGTIAYTASVLDLDGTDILTVSKTSGVGNFAFDTNACEVIFVTLGYSSRLSENTFTVGLQVSDGCNAAVTEIITINLINEGPAFTNLPASTTVKDTETAQRTLDTFTATDASGDSITCSIDSTNPTGAPFSLALVINGVYNIIQSASPVYTYSTTKWYDLRISCSDGVTTIYSNFQVDIVHNEPPFYNAGTGYLPASTSVDRSSGVSIYQLDYDDPESGSGDTVSVVTGSTACSGGGACPFTVSSSGEVTTNAVLDLEGYDLEITIQDNNGNTVGPYILSIVTSGRPYTFNADPVIVNLPHTITVMEHTTIGIFLFKVLYLDENPSDTFTLAKVSVSNAHVDTYFEFDTATGIISVKADIDFETTGAGGWEMVISVTDGSDTQHAIASATVTFTIVNINEGVTLTIGTNALAADETTVRGTVFPDPSISATDVDTGDNQYFSMECGDESKYFYMDTSTRLIHFAREYDMDAGLTGTATCNVSVRDTAGLRDSGLITLTLNNINDNNPKFPKNFYVFFVSTSTTFFTEVANMAASDADSDAFGSTNGILTYQFDPVSPTEEYFQIDAAGMLYVRNLTTYTDNTYVFSIVATDSGGLTGTCTVTVVFSGVSTTTTTTTERSLTFSDDYQNYFWIFIIAIGLVAIFIVIGFMIWKDPAVNNYMQIKMLKLSEWCRKKPRAKEPRRTVGRLTVTVNKKKLENDPDNALPWELMAKDNEIPEVNEVQEMIEKRKEKRDRDYKMFTGGRVFEKGKGGRPDSGRAAVHSAASNKSSDGDSPTYATFQHTGADKVDDGGGDQWDDRSERRVMLTPVTDISCDELSGESTEEN